MVLEVVKPTSEGSTTRVVVAVVLVVLVVLQVRTPVVPVVPEPRRVSQPR